MSHSSLTTVIQWRGTGPNKAGEFYLLATWEIPEDMSEILFVLVRWCVCVGGGGDAVIDELNLQSRLKC